MVIGAALLLAPKLARFGLFIGASRRATLLQPKGTNMHHDDRGAREPQMFQHPDDDRKATAFWLRIDEANGNLESVSSAAAFHASTALSALQLAFREPDDVLSLVERDEMLTALANAHAFVRLEFGDLDRSALRRGFDGASALVMFLATPVLARVAWSVDEIERHDAAVQIVRQELHNRSLVGELADLERALAGGQGEDAILERRIRSKYARLASNRIAILAAERRLAAAPSPRRSKLRLVG